MMLWKVTFNDETTTIVEASWIIEAIVEACLKVGKNYTDAVRAVYGTG
jgi:hypothetical protein